MSVRHHCSTERVSNLLHISELPLLQKSEQLELKLHEDISFQNSRHIGRLGDWERLTLTSSKLSKSWISFQQPQISLHTDSVKTKPQWRLYKYKKSFLYIHTFEMYGLMKHVWPSTFNNPDKKLSGFSGRCYRKSERVLLRVEIYIRYYHSKRHYSPYHTMTLSLSVFGDSGLQWTSFFDWHLVLCTINLSILLNKKRWEQRMIEIWLIWSLFNRLITDQSQNLPHFSLIRNRAERKTFVYRTEYQSQRLSRLSVSSTKYFRIIP